MDNLKKWGVRKYKRKVVVHNQTAGADDEHDDQDEDVGCGQSPQSLVLPYHRQQLQHHERAEASARAARGAAAEQSGGSVAPHGWGYFADSKWPAEVSATERGASYRVASQ
ncbi:hypothetical protein HIM_01992 [Hirsutella minnesotensis 3608]|nr:hypothetical protein HIM_01992 [Hirsutella minnesotensis 3608]